MQHQMVTSPTRPSRAEIEPAALAVLSRHSAALLATARRYSATPEDAEDAYQRGVEILLTKAPTTTEEELVPWLKTVVKHEAFAVAKATGRAVPHEEPLAREPDERAWTDDRAERYERLRVAAEAMAGLKPQEIRCLLLKAEGLSYQEICSATAFSYTKVNRCISEGRRAFLKRVAHIESGAECERLAPLISKMADGEASATEMRLVRPHLKGCLSCKATLREYRATPSRLAGLVPPVAVLAGGSGGSAGFVARILQAMHDRLGGLGDAAGAKAAAVAASAVVVAGGGAAGVDALHHDPPRVEPAAFPDAKTADPAPSAPAPTTPAASAPDPSSAAIQAVTQTTATAPSGDRGSDPVSPAPPAALSPEFDPGMASPVAERSAPAAAAPRQSPPAGSPPSRSTPAPSGPAAPAPTRSKPSAGAGGGEFGP
jgi:RNA polymerase sigma factor (sigma-70 family)